MSGATCTQRTKTGSRASGQLGEIPVPCMCVVCLPSQGRHSTGGDVSVLQWHGEASSSSCSREGQQWEIAAPPVLLPEPWCTRVCTCCQPPQGGHRRGGGVPVLSVCKQGQRGQGQPQGGAKAECCRVQVSQRHQECAWRTHQLCRRGAGAAGVCAPGRGRSRVCCSVGSQGGC
jgi:hypothetical protein